MNKFLQLLAKTNALFKNNPLLGYLFAVQAITQFRVTTHFLQFNGLLAAIAVSFALALAHVIPAYLVYVVGEGTGLAKTPGLKSKILFAFLGGILALILSLTFTACVLGILCQPMLPLVVEPTIAAAGLAGLIGSAYGSFLDVLAVYVILANDDTGDE